MMENRLFNVPIDMASRNSFSNEGIGSQIITQNSIVQFDSFDLNNQNQSLDGYSLLPTLRGLPINNLHTDNQTVVADSDLLLASFGRNVAREPEFQEHFVGGTPISGHALPTSLVPSRSGLQENLTNLAISEPSMYPLEVLRTYASNDYACGLNSSFASSINYGCDEVFGNMNAKGDITKFSASVELGGKTPLRTGFQPYSSMDEMEPNSWISSNSVNMSADNLYGLHKFSNELSLSLSTSQPSTVNGNHVSDQCSEISCSGITRHCLKEITRLGSEQTSSGSKELSLSFGSYKGSQFSQMISGSRYLQVIQELLAQIASYSLENLDQTSFTGRVRGGANMLFSSNYSTEGVIGTTNPNESLDDRFEVKVDAELQKRALEAKKRQLLTLLQLVDDRYNQCLDEIHTVVSAFHAATELDPHIHARFTLQTISFLYKSLRERISNQILSMGEHFDNGDAKETEGSLETSYFQKQWTLQQLKKREHQLWRPQRGLPERSVSVLRAWMFQNFLHPYPKDAEKHLLAVKSGLTRSQVSNWFINARVRLWKPMIEEMYAEMNRRKGRQTNEGSNSNRINHISISNLRFDMN